MGFVLELHQPLLCLAVDGHRHLDGAGVNLLALVQIGNHALLFQGLHAHQRHIHQRHNAVGVLAVHLVARVVVFLQSVLDDLAERVLLNFNLAELCQEGGVTAVIGPVGVNHAQLGYAGVAVLGVAKVVAAEFEVVERHA